MIVLLLVLFFGIMSFGAEPNAELRRIEQQLKEKRRNLLELETKEKSFLKAISELDQGMQSLQQLRTKTLASAKQLEKNVSQLKQQTDRLLKDIEHTRLQLHYKIQNLFVLFHQNKGRLFLENLLPVSLGMQEKRGTQSILKQFYIRKWVQNDMALLHQFAKRVQNYGTKKEEHARSLQQLSKERSKLEHETHLLKASKTDREKAIAQVRQDKKRTKKLEEELQKRQKELTALIQRLLQKKRLAQKKKPTLKGKEEVFKKGPFTWPVLKGKVLERFGQKGKRGLGIPSQGIHVLVPMSTPVRAIWSGSVVYEGFLKGFGQIVILDHGQEVHSLYAHLDSVVVVVGQRVQEGKHIAFSGESESLDGPKLYFEIRKDGIPKNPERFLK